MSQKATKMHRVYSAYTAFDKAQDCMATFVFDLMEDGRYGVYSEDFDVESLLSRDELLPIQDKSGSERRRDMVGAKLIAVFQK